MIITRTSKLLSLVVTANLSFICTAHAQGQPTETEKAAEEKKEVQTQTAEGEKEQK